MATKLEGGKALVAGPLKQKTFFAASLNDVHIRAREVRVSSWLPN